MTPLRSLLSLSAFFLALGGCVGPASLEVDSPPPWESAGPLRPVATVTGATDPAVRGVWRSRGYGWILDVDATGITRYQAGASCYVAPRPDGALSEMDSATYRYFRLLPDGDSAIFQLLDGDTNVVFDRLPALPGDCTREPVASATAVAETFLDDFERHYAFFDRRPPDFADRKHRLSAAMRPDMSDDLLWQALSAFMADLSDSHTKLIGTVDGEKRRVQDGQGITLPRMRAAEGGEGRWLGSLIDQTTQQLGSTAHTAGRGRIVWGVIDGRVGYLQIFVMGGFTDRTDFATPEWATAEMAAFNTALDQAFTAFAGLDTVIVDLSNNRGGWDRVAKALPGRFTDRPFLAMTTQARGSGLPPFPVEVQPYDGPRFEGPVYLMTSDVTVSGGEIATLAFRQLPQVTQVGTTTRGSFSTPLPKPLPNGWLLELSNEVFAAPDGTVFEETGLAPDMVLDIYPAADPVKGHWRAVETIVRGIEPTDPSD